VLLAGCKVEARVDVSMRSDGSGTITTTIMLDRDAVSRLGSSGVRLEGLKAAGWRVSEAAAGGGRRYTLTHAFVDEADLARRFRDLVAATGVLRAPEITRVRRWYDARETIALTVDLRHLSTGIRSDAALTQRLTAAGLDVQQLDEQLRSDLGHALTVTAVVHAPGGETRSVTVVAGQDARVSASSAQTYTGRVVLVVVGAALVLVAGALTAASLLATSRRRRRSSASSRR